MVTEARAFELGVGAAAEVVAGLGWELVEADGVVLRSLHSDMSCFSPQYPQSPFAFLQSFSAWESFPSGPRWRANAGLSAVVELVELELELELAGEDVEAEGTFFLMLELELDDVWVCISPFMSQ